MAKPDRTRRRAKSRNERLTVSWLPPARPQPAEPRGGQLTRWQEILWPKVQEIHASPVMLRGTLHLSGGTASNTIASRPTGVSCGIRQVVTSPRGQHGVQLFLSDPSGPTETSAFLLTPALYTRFSGSSTRRSDVRACSLSEPVVVLEIPGLRAEFVVREVSYRQDSPPPDLLRSLTLEAVVWKTPLPQETAGSGATP